MLFVFVLEIIGFYAKLPDDQRRCEDKGEVDLSI